MQDYMGSNTGKQEPDTMQDDRQSQIIFRHRGMRTITKDLQDIEKLCGKWDMETAAARIQLDASKINNNIWLYI